MPLCDKSLRVFLVTAAQKGFEITSSLLASEGRFDIVWAKNAGEARRILMSEAFDIAVINTPLGDENGISLACFISAEKQTETIMFVKSDFFDEVSEKVMDSGVLCVAKPINKIAFHQAFRLALASAKRSATLLSENRQLLLKLDEIKLIERAKWALIEHEGLCESEAHRRIEKLAMDLRISRAEVAKQILSKHSAVI